MCRLGRITKSCEAADTPALGIIRHLAIVKMLRRMKRANPNMLVERWDIQQNNRAISRRIANITPTVVNNLAKRLPSFVSHP